MDTSVQSASFLFIRENLRPLQHPLAPGVYQSGDEDENEDNAFQNGEQTQRAESYRPREKKDRFHIEHQEHQSEDVILSLELHPAIAYCFDAAFISCLFNGIGLL